MKRGRKVGAAVQDRAKAFLARVEGAPARQAQKPPGPDWVPCRRCGSQAYRVREDGMWGRHCLACGEEWTE